MSRTQSFTSSDKEKNPSTPRAKLGHRRVDETGETTYKKASGKKKPNKTNKQRKPKKCEIIFEVECKCTVLSHFAELVGHLRKGLSLLLN